MIEGKQNNNNNNEKKTKLCNFTSNPSIYVPWLTLQQKKNSYFYAAAAVVRLGRKVFLARLPIQFDSLSFTFCQTALFCRFFFFFRLVDLSWKWKRKVSRDDFLLPTIRQLGCFSCYSISQFLPRLFCRCISVTYFGAGCHFFFVLCIPTAVISTICLAVQIVTTCAVRPYTIFMFYRLDP